jgi:pimeloyl-ACP methyl ester carboxylesterase
MDTVQSKDGTSIAYKRSGTGPALVLVHDTTADHTRWAYVLPMPEQRFTVYTVDRRGRGQSEDSAVYSTEREYEDIAAVVSSSGIGELAGAFLRCTGLPGSCVTCYESLQDYSL